MHLYIIIQLLLNHIWFFYIIDLSSPKILHPANIAIIGM